MVKFVVEKMRISISHFGLALLALIMSVSLHAQQNGSFSKDHNVFIKEITKSVSTYNKEAEDEKVAKFTELWTSLDPKLKKYFIEDINFLKKKGLRTVPYLTSFMEQVYYAANNKGLSGAKLDNLYKVNRKVFKAYDSKKIKAYLATTRNFFKSDLLFTDVKHNWHVTGENFELKFIEEKELIEEELIEETGGQDDTGEWKDENKDGWGDDNGDAFGDWDDQDDAENWGTLNEDEEVISDAVAETLFSEPILSVPNGPVFEFKGVTLDLEAKYDSVAIQNTSGTFIITENKFVGEGGKFDWSNTELGDKAFVELNKYEFKTNTRTVKAEGIMLNYNEKLHEPIKGIFEFSSVRRRPNESAKYPRFMSYTNDVHIKGLEENVKYKGGFSLEGARVLSTSLNEGLCVVDFYLNGEEKFKAKSKNFTLNDSTIASNLCAIVIYENHDSIYNPGVSLKYNNVNKELKVTRDKGAFKNSAFIDHHHQLEIHVDAIKWVLNDTVIQFYMTNARNERPAFFNSAESFNQSEYIRLKGFFPFHPLQLILNYVNRTKKTSFNALDLAKFSRQKDAVVKDAMKTLMRHGYIDYNTRTGLVILKPKTRHYVESHKGDKDFDIISIKSVDPPSVNAHLHITTNTMIVEGVDEFRLSDSSNVVCYPADRRIMIKENRNIEFNGRVHTTGYQFNGRDFKFNYDEFNMELAHIDSIKFIVEVKDSVTGEVRGSKTLENKLSYSSGTLTIDKADNKSGKVNYPNFPHFDANKGASVVFNQGDVLGGVYDTAVKYKIPPFDIDSLDNKIDGNVKFNGAFNSGGIFPEFEEELGVMEDLSFGFEHDVPDEGYPLYETNARFYGIVKMSKQGIRGEGYIDFLNTRINSSDFVFYQDSVKAIGSSSVTKEGVCPDAHKYVTFPSVNVSDYELVWYPKVDSMILTSYASPFETYDNKAQLTGSVTITKSGMKGNGMMRSEGSLTISENIILHQHKYKGRDAQFEILTEVQGKPAMKSDEVSIEVDFENDVAHFQPEPNSLAVNEFPYLKYKSSLNQGSWDIKGRKVTMIKPDEIPLKKSYFYSIHPKQDSIAFNAQAATYYMDSLKLHVKGVPELRIADASIRPFKSELNITENAQIETLHRAEITLDTAGKFHLLTEGDLNIKSRNKFDGKAIYQFINFEQDSLPIQFNRFELVEEKVDKKSTIIQTVSNGAVLEEDSFYIAPQMLYKGNATMYAKKKQLEFDGFVKLDIKSLIATANWIKFSSRKSDGIRIDIKDQYAPDGKPLLCGVHFSNSKKNFYSTFLETKKSVNDQSLLTASGFLTHNLESGNFEVGSNELLSADTRVGSKFGFNETEGKFVFEGNMNLINPDMDGKLDMEMLFAGRGINSLSDTSVNLNGVMVLNYFVPEALYDIMGKDMAEMAYLLGLEKVNNSSDSLLHSIANLESDKAAESYQKSTKLNYLPIYKAGKNLSKGIVLNNLNLNYSAAHRSWHSVGKLGVSNVLKNDVNAYVDGFLEIHKSSVGDRVSLYLQLDDNNWYYMEYSNDALVAISSSNEFNDYVESKSTMAKNELKGLYYFTLASESQKSRFLKKYNESFLNGELQIIEEEADDDDSDAYDDLNEEEDEFDQDLDEAIEDESDEDNVEEEVDGGADNVHESGSDQ